MDVFVFVLAIFAYVIGAIPVGYLVARLKGIADIRAHGSGNIGATNVSRLLGLHYFFLIFSLDAGKAFLFIYTIKPYIDFDYLCIFAGILLFGNGCSIFLRGTGGKGVATLCGLLGALCPMATVVLLTIWACIVTLTRTVGIASVIAAACLPFYAYIMHNNAFFLFSLFAALWIIWKHKPNITQYFSSNKSTLRSF
jgi:acyl phosphate:glycerol-3-phosphate acyltransferase